MHQPRLCLLLTRKPVQHLCNISHKLVVLIDGYCCDLSHQSHVLEGGAPFKTCANLITYRVVKYAPVKVRSCLVV